LFAKLGEGKRDLLISPWRVISPLSQKKILGGRMEALKGEG